MFKNSFFTITLVLGFAVSSTNLRADAMNDYANALSIFSQNHCKPNDPQGTNSDYYKLGQNVLNAFKALTPAQEKSYGYGFVNTYFINNTLKNIYSTIMTNVNATFSPSNPNTTAANALIAQTINDVLFKLATLSQ